jgi:branched-chain amino acid transport system ATP-binding protein
MSALLHIQDLQKNFGGVHVAKNINFQLKSGEIHCLIGPNGAGKSSFFRLVLGEYAPSGGSIWFENRDITGLRSSERIRRGISVKFQVPGVFQELSVRQNALIALQRLHKGAELEDEIDHILEFTGLAEEAATLAGNLSHGQKQWLEIGMAVSLKPKLLMLDEPTAGMSPEETHQTGEMIHALNAQGMSVLAVEHDMSFVRQIAQRVTVLHFGAIFAQGTIDDIVADDRVAEIYLGKSNGH